jgi:hypothetical protein
LLQYIIKPSIKWSNLFKAKLLYHFCNYFMFFSKCKNKICYSTLLNHLSSGVIYLRQIYSIIFAIIFCFLASVKIKFVKYSIKPYIKWNNLFEAKLFYHFLILLLWLGWSKLVSVVNCVLSINHVMSTFSLPLDHQRSISSL